jgi:hypothetical protein
VTNRPGKRNVLGFDQPAHRDWLFWVVGVTCACGAVTGVSLGGVEWWTGASELVGGTALGGLILGSLRELVRGYRERDPAAGRRAAAP